jgi:hypothetical protein
MDLVAPLLGRTAMLASRELGEAMAVGEGGSRSTASSVDRLFSRMSRLSPSPCLRRLRVEVHRFHRRSPCLS